MPSFSTLEGLVVKLNSSEEAKAQLSGVTKTIQFVVDQERFFLDVSGSGAELKKGAAANPSVTLTAGDSVLDDILNGRMNGIQAFITGRLAIAGDIMLAQKLVSVLDRSR